MRLPSDIQAQIDAALAKNDVEAAGKLAGAIAAAISAGQAQGFESDLAALRRLTGLGTLAKAAPGSGMPPDLLAKSKSLIAAIERAESPEAQKRAVEAAERFLADDEARRAIAKAFSTPKLMGVAGCVGVGR